MDYLSKNTVTLKQSRLLRHTASATLVCGREVDEYQQLYRDDPRIEISAQEERGTGADLVAASSQISADMLLICNGDTVVDVSLRDLLAFHATHDKLASIVISRRTDVPNAGAFSVNPDGLVLASAEASNSSGSTTQASWAGASTGMFLCEIAFLKTLRPSDFPSIEKELLPALIQRNQLCAYDNSDNLMFDYGTPERLRQFSEIQDIVQRILSK